MHKLRAVISSILREQITPKDGCGCNSIDDLLKELKE